MAVRSARENIIAALFNEVPDYVPCCPDISNMIPAKLAGKPFWDIYLNRDPPLGLAQAFAVNELGVDGFYDQGRLDPSLMLKRKPKKKSYKFLEKGISLKQKQHSKLLMEI